MSRANNREKDKMRKFYTTEDDFEDKLQRLRAPFEPLELWFSSKEKISAVEDIIENVYKRGNEAICEYTEKFDNVRIPSDKIRISEDEILSAYNRTEESLKKSIGIAIENVTAYQEHIRVYQSKAIQRKGIKLQTWYQPLQRVGICVPGASAPLPSTVIMSAVPAKVAGVKEIVVMSPPRYEGTIHPLILACCYMLGINEVYRMGGAHAVAGIAIGTDSIKAVDKIVGPGNIYVQIAKKLLFGVVDIDSFAGPSEIVVLADDSANPKFVAADLLGQAEHDPGCAILITDNEELSNSVEKEVETLLKELPKSEQTRKCLDEYGAIIIADTLDSAINLVNRLSPEHLSVQTKDVENVVCKCTTAGAIFVGSYTSEALGDYVAGPSHVLPTGGTARFFSPLNVMDFIRHTSVIRYDKEALKNIYPVIRDFTEAEQLIAHQRSASVRLK